MGSARGTPEWRTSSEQYHTRPTAGAASPILAILNWIVANKDNFDNSGSLNRYLKEFAGKSTDIERSEPLWIVKELILSHVVRSVPAASISAAFAP